MKITNILIVEYDPFCNMMYRKLFKDRDDYKISFSETYNKTVPQLLKNPDIVILDHLNDPKKTVLELLPVIECPVIIFCGKDDIYPESELKTYKNIVAVLPKPKPTHTQAVSKVKVIIDAAVIQKDMLSISGSYDIDMGYTEG